MNGLSPFTPQVDDLSSTKWIPVPSWSTPPHTRDPSTIHLLVLLGHHLPELSSALPWLWTSFDVVHHLLHERAAQAWHQHPHNRQARKVKHHKAQQEPLNLSHLLEKGAPLIREYFKPGGSQFVAVFLCPQKGNALRLQGGEKEPVWAAGLTLKRNSCRSWQSTSEEVVQILHWWPVQRSGAWSRF